MKKLLFTTAIALLTVGSAQAQIAQDWLLFDKTPLDQQVKAGINSAGIAGANSFLIGGHPLHPGLAECRTLPSWINNVLLEKEIKRLEAELALRKAAEARGPAK